MAEPGADMSFSQASDNSQTAAEYINSQLKLEADAREALPYAFDTCTKPMGALRQSLYACLTCNPPDHEPAAVCYSCSISCHGEHTLVELFNKRNFVCDCGTTRYSTPCTLRVNPSTNTKGVDSETAAENKYNDNFKNRFCGCKCDYDAEKQKGAMFQCLGLDGGCGEDWWHPWCVAGLGASWADGKADDELIPPGFPKEDDFDGFICYQCVEANPWIKRYAGTPGFLAPVVLQSTPPLESVEAVNKKRRAPDGAEPPAKRVKQETSCRYEQLPAPLDERISIFLTSSFRDQLCRCADCFPRLTNHPYLQEEEESYEPPLSDDGDSTVGSLLDRGERALTNVDRVRAIEGVMAYNHLKEKLTPFFKEFAESGKAISAEDIKAHFAKLRGDEEAIKEASAAASDNRQEQSGY